jgi:hypothetical protein
VCWVAYKITKTILHNWTHTGDKSVNLSILVYGRDIQVAPQLQALQKALINPRETDRAGADNERVHQELIARLKSIHEGVYRGYHINWRIWAAHIYGTTKPHERDEACLKPPPFNLINQFVRAPANAEQRMVQMRDALSFTDQVIISVQSQLPGIRSAMEDAGRIITDGLTRLQALENALKIHESCCKAMGTVLGPQEGSAALAVLMETPDQEDVDHA